MATKKKAPAKKASKSPVKKPAAKKAVAKKKPAAKKPAAKKPAAKKAPAKKPAAKKPAAKKPVAKKVVKAPELKKVAVVKVKRPLVVEPTKPVLVVPKNTKTFQYTQTELLDCMTQYCGFEKRKGTKEFYDSFHQMIQAALKEGYKLMLPGLGKLQVKKTKPRMGINPKTQEPIKIPAKRKVAFTAAKVLKEAVL